MDREEIIAAMVNEYRKELESLSDAELMFHWDANKKMHEMTDKEWESAFTSR